MVEEKKTSQSVSIHNRKFYGEGDIIMRQGDKGNQAYLIQSGRVRVYAEHGDKKKELANLGPGEIFGEMALVVDEVRTATVEALENTSLILITRPMMIEKLARTDPTIKALVPMLIDRIKRGNKAALNKKETVEDMGRLAGEMYQNICDSLDAKQKRSLEQAVLPKLEDFLKSIDDFWKLYGD